MRIVLWLKPLVFRYQFWLAALKVPALILVLVSLGVGNFSSPSPAEAAVGINEQVNFQARLLNAQGATVPDGNYNMQFKIYQDGDGVLGGGDETLKWTETRLNNNSQGVSVKNGYFSVQLGSVFAFGSNVDWNQSVLWLSIEVGNTNGTCTPFSNCAPDGEMTPFKRLGSNPYALNSGRLGGLSSTQFVQLAQGVQTDTSGTNPSIFINKTAAANILQLQRSGADVMLINSTGEVTFKPQTDDTDAFKIQNADGSSTVFNVDTTAALKVTVLNLDATGNVDFADAAAGDTIDIGDSLAATQDTVNIQGNINIATDTDPDTVNIGGNGDSTSINGGVTIGAAVGFAETIVIGDLGDTFSLNSTGLRVSTTGSLTNVGTNITAAGAVTIASSGAGNDVIINGADILDVQDAAVFSANGTFNTTATIGNGSGNDYLEFIEEATDPSCAAGDYKVWARSTGSNKLRKCENGTISDLDTSGGSQTPWTSDIDADGFDLFDLSNLQFRETTGAPAASEVALFRDNTGDLNLNVLTGKTFNVQVNGTDEYNFSSTGLAFNANDITGVGNITGNGAITIASSGAGNDIFIDGADILRVVDAAQFAGTATFEDVVTVQSDLEVQGAVSFLDATGGETINIGDSLGAAQDTINIQGDVNLGTDSDPDTIAIGDGGNADTFSLNSTGLRVSTTGSLTNVGTNITAAGALTVASAASSSLTIDSASGRVIIATGDFLQTAVSGVSGAAAGDIWYDTAASKYKINEAGVTKTLCNTTDAGCGAGGSTTLQAAYDAGSSGDQLITLDGTQDSIIVRNPSSSGSDSAFVFKVEQLNTGIATAGLYVDNRGTGYALRVDDASGDTTPFVIDSSGRVGVGTDSIIGSTERLLQVGSPTNRGNVSVYGDIVSQGISDITGLTGIKDIFLYDTTADSDGGRWIDWATTDQLSWFTEALDDGPDDPCNIASDDRCYTTNFPRKAILVVTADDLYIFDASTNDMWMKFSQDAAGWALGVATNNDISSVTAINGVIYVSTNGTANSGLYVFDFVNDRMWNIDGTDRSGANVGISQRNAAVTYNSDNSTAFDLSVSGTASEWEDINDVSAVYINSSTTPSATGVATTTSPGSGLTFVALATNSGVTVINMTAQKLLQYSDVTADDYTSVALTKRARMYALNTTSDQLEMWINFDTDKASEINGAFDARYDETVGAALWRSTPNIIAGAPDALEVIERGSLAESNSDIVYVGHSLGLTELHLSLTGSANGWSKFYDTTRQTMFMPTAIDMALMMDDTSGTLANDTSFNNTDMTILGSPTLAVSGVRGKAINFDNSNDYLCSDADQNGACDVDASFNMSTTGWTLSMWFKHSTTAPASGVDTLFEKCVNATPGQAIGCVAVYMTTTGAIVSANDDDATWTQGSSYDITATSSLTYNDNQWHQLIVSRTNANDVDTYIDGNPLNLSTGTGLTLTFDGSQIVTIGGSCSPTTGANCAAANALNFWDGQIDDVTYSNGTTTVAQVTAAQARSLYNDARPLLAKRVVNVTDATTATSTTIGDSGESWTPNEFAGMMVTLTGGTGAGQTRRVTGNTTTTLTVAPAFQTTPDTTTDFEVDPEALYGATDSVKAVGITGENPMGQARQMCVGTNDGSDGGGVTCYNHQAGPNLIAELFHGDSEQVDDFGAEWTGTDYDDINSVDLSTRSLVIGSEAHFYSETEDVRLGQGLDYISNQLFNIRAELINDGINSALEVGFTGGADLAENYSSKEALEAGEVVSLEPNEVGSIIKTTKAHDDQMLGIVATAPGLILGSRDEHSYPVALVGRVPVKVTNINGPIKAGDRITSSSVPGYAMKATEAGRVLGTALDDLSSTTGCPSGIQPDLGCGTITVFVNLVDYNGPNIDTILSDAEQQGLVFDQKIFEPLTDLVGGDDMGRLGKASKILSYLASKRRLSGESESEILADRVNAVTLNAADIYGQNIFATNFTVAQFKANRIEGLELLVSGPTEFRGSTLFKGLVSFVEKTVFDNDVSFKGRTTFNNDTAGFAVIKPGQQEVKVKFDKQYEQLPVVTVAIKNGKFAAYTYKDLTNQGFTIVIPTPPAKRLSLLGLRCRFKMLKPLVKTKLKNCYNGCNGL